MKRRPNCFVRAARTPDDGAFRHLRLAVAAAGLALDIMRWLSRPLRDDGQRAPLPTRIE